MRQKNKKSLRGFSIVEVMIAVAVIGISLVVILQMLAKGILQSTENSRAIIAAELAQEGVELARNVRDNDFAAGNDGFLAFDNARRHCRLDFYIVAGIPPAPIPCSPGPNGLDLGLSWTGSTYRHLDAGPQLYARRIWIDYNRGRDEAVIRSYVTWRGDGTVPNGNNTSQCSLDVKCTFAEATLTSWK